jgi:hypothetical protein
MSTSHAPAPFSLGPPVLVLILNHLIPIQSWTGHRRQYPPPSSSTSVPPLLIPNPNAYVVVFFISTQHVVTHPRQNVHPGRTINSRHRMRPGISKLKCEILFGPRPFRWMGSSSGGSLRSVGHSAYSILASQRELACVACHYTSPSSISPTIHPSAKVGPRVFDCSRDRPRVGLGGLEA